MRVEASGEIIARDELSDFEPWLKWPGGKRALAPRLVPEILATNPTLYIEPFLGGGAVALALPARLPKLLSDVNPQLVDCWLCMQVVPDLLYRELDDVYEQYGNSKERYLAAREEFNKLIGHPRRMWPRRSALFIYLNRHCFNGLWRTNASGRFNVPFGKYEAPKRFHWNELSGYTRHLKTATILGDHYAKVIGDILTRRLNTPLRRGDLKAARLAMEGVAIYSDPPYDGTFDGYAAGGFGPDDQAQLAMVLSSAALAGAAVWATNSDTELIRTLYSPWAQIDEIDERHSVGATGDRRGRRACVLIRAGAAIR